MRWKLKGWVTRGLWRMGVREASGALRSALLHGGELTVRMPSP